MRTLSLKSYDFVLFFSGFNLIFFNFLIIHPVTIAVNQAEIAVFIFTLAYFTGISIGYIISDKLSEKFIKLSIPLIYIIQLLMVVSLPLFYHMVGQVAGSIFDVETHLARIMLFILIMIAGTSIYAIFLPKLVKLPGKSMRYCYTLEILGSLMAILIIPFSTVMPFQFLVALYFFIFLGIYNSIRSNRIIFFGLIFTSIVFFAFFNKIDYYFSKKYYQYKMPYRHVVAMEHIQYTPYHKIEIIKSLNGKLTLILNGKVQFGESSHYSYSYFLAEYPTTIIGNPRLCLLGCGSMSTIGRIGAKCQNIRIVDLDEGVFTTSRKYFQKYNRINTLDNWSFTADDAKHFLANNSDRYDLILHDIPPAKSRQTALTYTKEFFQLVKRNLADEGIFVISSLTPLYSKSQYGRRMMATLTDVFDRYFILTFKNGVYFYGGGEKLQIPEKDTLIRNLTHKKKNEVRILMQDDIDHIVEGLDIITINNLRDLIFD